jgi:hypothetical protein
MTVKTDVRTDLEALPLRLRKLRVDPRGYPVPWFVAWVDGPDGPETVPEFRAMDSRKFRAAVKQKLCWVCGEPLGRWLAFPIGPMCAITRTISEPPSHLECAEWSVRNCPFLSQPSMVRREDHLPADMEEPAGLGIKRNPGVMCLWITRSYELFDDGTGKALITIGDPDRVMWWCEGRAATRAEVDASVTSGLPILLTQAKRDGKFAVEALGRFYDRAQQYFPGPVPSMGWVKGDVAVDPRVPDPGTPSTRENTS